ncbi:unnamed protein product [Parnassius mnemosyne]|uniref:Uncharacterized protein n=1 Tax=Parnassius mnemosyne TaxID=213953 RepID=A0AAV1L5B6_9NEOP
MKLRNRIVCILLVVAVVTLAEGSLLERQSLLRPNGMEPCFTCRAEDKPWSYSLLTFFGKLKNMLVRAVNVIAASTKQQKIT